MMRLWASTNRGRDKRLPRTSVIAESGAALPRSAGLATFAGFWCRRGGSRTSVSMEGIRLLRRSDCAVGGRWEKQGKARIYGEVSNRSNIWTGPMASVGFLQTLKSAKFARCGSVLISDETRKKTRNKSSKRMFRRGVARGLSVGGAMLRWCKVCRLSLQTCER